MPHSKSLSTIFVAIPKTGTTSLISALKKLQKNSDNGELSLLKDQITPEFRVKYGLNSLNDSSPGRAKHLSAVQLKYILGDEEFDRCFKFSVVRNPWARVVTRYFYTHVNNEPSAEGKIRRGTTRKFHNLSFESWVEKRWKHLKEKNKQIGQLQKLVDIDGKILVDYVGRLESIQQCLDDICEKIGVERMQMPHVNTSGKRAHYSTFYNQSTMEMIQEVCQDDIQYFDFKFEDRK